MFRVEGQFAEIHENTAVLLLHEDLRAHPVRTLASIRWEVREDKDVELSGAATDVRLHVQLHQVALSGALAQAGLRNAIGCTVYTTHSE